MPKSMKQIAEGAFSGCENLKQVTFAGDVFDGITRGFLGADCVSVKILKGATNVCGFVGWKALESVEIPDTVTSIGQAAFFRCTNLKTINFPDSLKVIGQEAFYGCTGLTEVVLPKNLSVIDEAAFVGCTGLKKATIRGKKLTIGERAFEGCENLETVVIGEGTDQIQSWAFQYCNNLQSMTLPDSLTDISDTAFFENAGGIVHGPVDHMMFYCRKGTYAESWVKKHQAVTEWQISYLK